MTKKVTDVELLIDTNFFISLIDLNTEESYHTCKQLFDLCKKMGFRFKILNTTVEQIKVLLNNRISDFADRDFIGSVKTADVFNACIRQKIDKTQLERIKDNVFDKLQELGIFVIQDANIKPIIDNAKKGQTYKDLKQKRNYELSALNDAIAEEYVKTKRGTKIQEFADVKCWFLHNSFHSHYFSQNQKVSKRYSLGANELLVLLWMSNPSQMNTIQDKVIAQSTLSSYVTKYRRHKMPSTDILKIIKNRADQALERGQITEKDIYNTCLRMTEGEITNDDVKDIENLSDNDFALRFKEFSKSTKEQIEVLNSQNADKDNIIEQLSEQQKKDNSTINQQQQEIDDLNKSIQQTQYERKIDEYVNKKIKQDQKKGYIYIFFIVSILVLWLINNKYVFVPAPKCLLALIGFVLYGLPFVIPVVKIKISVFSSIFRKNTAREKYQKEFDQSDFN
jgi:hypothetical protein